MWFVNATDGPGDIIVYGFPLIYKAPGFHTSLSTQFFILELIIDFLVYFTSLSLIYFTFRSFFKFRISKVILKICQICAAMLIVFNFAIYVLIFPENVFILKRDFEVEIHKSELNYFWENHHVVTEFQDTNGT